MLGKIKERIKYILFLWQEHRIRAILLIFLSITNTIMTVAYPVIIARIIDSLVMLQGKMQLIYNIIILLSVAFIAVIAYSTLQLNRVYINISIFWNINLKLTIFVLKMGRKFFEKFDHGELMTRLGDDIDKISWYSCSGIFRFFDAVSIITFSMVVMGHFSWKLTMYIFIPITLIIFLLLLSDKKYENAFTKLQENISRVNTSIEKTFSSIKVVKSNNMENFSDYEFKKILGKRKKAELRVALFDSLWHSSDYFVNYTGLLIILWFGGKMVIDGKISIGTFVAFMNYLYMMLEHLYSFAFFFIQTNRTFVSVKRHIEMLKTSDKNNPVLVLNDEHIFSDIDYQIKEEVRNDNRKNEKIWIKHIETIEFKNVVLEINKRRILDNVSFRINAGEFIGITGKVGSGKTIAMDILIGLEEPTGGKVYINGIDIKLIDIRSIREKIGMVFQEPILFSTTIYDNIVMKQKCKDFKKIYEERGFVKNIKANLEFKDIEKYEMDEKLKNVIKLSALKEDIKTFKDGINTLVGPKGIMVSGGQRERITIARAIYREPEVYIFDDSTRSLDSETEKKVLQNIKSIKENSTIIMITQRVASIKEADRIIIFENGKIRISGKHEELIKKDELYNQLIKVNV